MDFGAPPVLVDLEGGRRGLIAAQKSGFVYALDPDQEGKLLWQRRIGKGGFVGGIQSGIATDAQNVYIALSDLSGEFASQPDRSQPWQRRVRTEFGWIWNRARIRLSSSDDGGGTFALRLASGEQVWYTPPQCGGKGICRPAQLAPVTVIPGVVFSGSMDGTLRAYSTAGGAVVWNANTTGEYVTVNHIRAWGGTIAWSGPVVAGGIVYVNSGYPLPRGTAGNVLLAFSVDGK